MCVNCEPLLKAIDAYLAKVDVDLEKRLEREGFILPKLTVEFINTLEEKITETLLNETAFFIDKVKSAVKFEIPEGEPPIDGSTVIYFEVIKSDKLGQIDEELERYKEYPNWRRYIAKSENNIDDVIDLKKFAKYIFPNLIYSDTAKNLIAGIFRDMLGEYVPQLIEAYIQQTDRSLKLDAISKKTTAWIKSWSAELGNLMQLTSHRQLQNILVKGLNEGIGIPEFARRIQDSGIRNEYYRARRVAVTEVLRAHNVSAQEAYFQSPAVEQKRWQHTGSYRNKPRANHVAIDGQIVDKDKPYTLFGRNGGIYYPMFPTDPILPPEESINCHCNSQPIVNPAILRMSFEERQELQRKAVEDSNEVWQKELDMNNRAKAGIKIDPFVRKIQWRYDKYASPGEGKIIYEDGYPKGRNKSEVEFAKKINAQFGGNITLLNNNKRRNEGIKSPDFIWNGGYWELKEPLSIKDNATSDNFRAAKKQIKQSPGGMIFDYKCDGFDIKKVKDDMFTRFKRKDFDLDMVDVMIFHKGNLQEIVRFEK